jgi:hypothetical protein
MFRARPKGRLCRALRHLKATKRAADNVSSVWADRFQDWTPNLC